MEDKTKILPTEQKNIPRIYENAIEKMIDEIPKDYTELQKARYIYINLGKLLSYDERFLAGNSKAQKRIFKLAKENVIEFNQIKENKKFKGICVDLNRLYANTLRAVGIESYINYGAGLITIPHDSVSAKLDGHFYSCDLQRDLINIQLNCMTDFFGFHDEDDYQCDRILGEEEKIALDKSIGFTNYDYSGGKYISKLRNKFLSTNVYDEENEESFYDPMFTSIPFKERVEVMFRDISRIPGIKNLGYTERTRIYWQMLKYGLSYKEKENFRIDNLYTIDETTKLPKEVIEIFTVIHTKNKEQKFARYIYDHINKEYVPISNKDLLEKIEKENLQSRKQITGMQKIVRECQKASEKEKRYLEKLSRDPKKDYSQLLNIESQPENATKTKKTDDLGDIEF